MDPGYPITARPPQRPLGASQQPNLPIPSSPIASRQTLHDRKHTSDNAISISPTAAAGRQTWSTSRNDDLARKRDSGTTMIVPEQAEEDTGRGDTQLLDIADGSFEESVEIGDLSLAESVDRIGRETSLDEMPFHVLLDIVICLPPDDILSFACCSRTLYEVARSQSAWQRLYFKRPGWRIRQPIRPELDVQEDVFGPLGDTLDWRTLYEERRELERRWTRRSFVPEYDTIKPAKSAIYCSFALENYIITGSRNRSICFYEYESDEASVTPIFKIKDAHVGSVLCMVVDTEGEAGAGVMYTGGSDGKVNAWTLDRFLTDWNTFEGKPRMLKTLEGHRGARKTVPFEVRDSDSDSKPTGADKYASVWCRDTLNPFAEIDMLGGPINCIALHPEKQILVAAGCHGRITMYDLKTLETLQTFRSESRATVACVGFYEDLLVWGDTHLRIAQMDTGRIMHEQSANTELIRCFTIMPRMGRVITGSYSNQIRIWPLHSLRNQTVLKTPGRVLTISATATKIIAGDDQGNITVRDYGYGLTYEGYFD